MFVFFVIVILLSIVLAVLFTSGVCNIVNDDTLSYYVVILFCIETGTLAQRLECSPMARETWVQSQVESYQRL